MQTPDRKVQVGTLAGALSIVLIWGLSLAGVDVPGAVGAAFATILGAATAYLVPNPT